MNNNLYQNGYIPHHMNQNMNNYQTNYSENYVEYYLRNNLGQNIEAHISFPDSVEWRDSVFTGTLKDVGKDYLVIHNNQGTYVIWNIYIDYVVLPNSQN